MLAMGVGMTGGSRTGAGLSGGGGSITPGEGTSGPGEGMGAGAGDGEGLGGAGISRDIGMIGGPTGGRGSEPAAISSPTDCAFSAALAI